MKRGRDLRRENGGTAGGPPSLLTSLPLSSPLLDPFSLAFLPLAPLLCLSPFPFPSPSPSQIYISYWTSYGLFDIGKKRSWRERVVLFGRARCFSCDSPTRCGPIANPSSGHSQAGLGVLLSPARDGAPVTLATRGSGAVSAPSAFGVCHRIEQIPRAKSAPLHASPFLSQELHQPAMTRGCAPAEPRGCDLCELRCRCRFAAGP